IFWPVSAWRPFTKTSPSEIRASAARREHTPLSARNFWSRMGSGDEADMGRRSEDGRRKTEDGGRRREGGEGTSNIQRRTSNMDLWAMECAMLAGNVVYARTDEFTA